MRVFPDSRLRRNRSSEWLRRLLAEHVLSASDFVLPLFVKEGEGKEEIESLPGIFRYSIEGILEQVGIACELGIPAVALFPVVESDLKTECASEAFNEGNLICRTIRAIKDKFGDKIGVIADVALDPYNLLGHDGIVRDGKVLNDETNVILAKQVVALAKAGADIVAPSDMMDGRVGVIRKALDGEGFIDVKILSYAVKFASGFYGPFRDAVGSKGNLSGASKESYQMSFDRSREIFAEVEMDISEGADMIMVKPAGSYLDVISRVSDNFDVNVFAYQVSGEYSALKVAGEKGYLDYEKVMVESLVAIKRAGAKAIFCYDAIGVVGGLLP